METSKSLESPRGKKRSSSDDDSIRQDVKRPVPQDYDVAVPRSPIILKNTNDFENTYKLTNHDLGSGSYGYVETAGDRRTGAQVVVKSIKKYELLPDMWMEDKELGRVPKEIGVLAKIQHKNIVTLLNCYDMGALFKMVFESSGIRTMDLHKFLQEKPVMDEPLMALLFQQMVAAVRYLHDESVVHGDLKDKNMIVNDKFELKLIDFGSSSFLRPNRRLTFRGTTAYCCPDIFHNRMMFTTPAVDIWGLGVILYKMSQKRLPFREKRDTLMHKGNLAFTKEISTALETILESLLHPVSDNRPTIEELSADEWVTQPVDVETYCWNTVLNKYSNEELMQVIGNGGEQSNPDEDSDVDEPDSNIDEEESDSEEEECDSEEEESNGDEYDLMFEANRDWVFEDPLGLDEHSQGLSPALGLPSAEDKSDVYPEFTNESNPAYGENDLLFEAADRDWAFEDPLGLGLNPALNLPIDTMPDPAFECLELFDL